MTLVEELEGLFPPGQELRFGELHLARGDDGSFSARHVDNNGEDMLEKIDSVAALRELAKWDAGGEYRPLKTAPTLRSGWVTECTEAAQFLARLDAIYPAVFATWIAYSREDLKPVSLRKTLERQTGMYRFAGAITDQMANKLMRDLCSKGCVRKIAWPIDDACAVGRLTMRSHRLPVICTEACTFVVSEARRLAKEAYDAANAPAE